MKSKIFSVFPSFRGGKQSIMTLEQYVQTVRTGGIYKETVLAARQANSAGDTVSYKKIKGTQAVAAVGATFVGDSHRAEDIKAKSGLMVIDLDGYESIDSLENDFNKLCLDEFTWVVHKSIGGKGLAVVIRINPEKPMESYKGIEEYYHNVYGIDNTDKQCSNLNRLRFISYDPDIFVSEQTPVVFKKYPAVKKAPKSLSPVIFHTDEIGFLVEKIVESGIDLTNDYGTWIQIAHAIASVEPNFTGFGYFDAISRQSSKYDPQVTERKWAQCQGEGGVSIATLYHLARENGIRERYSPETTAIVQYASTHKKQAGSAATASAAKNFIKTMDPDLKIDEKAESIIEQVLASDVDYSKGLSNDSEIKQIENYIFDYYKPTRNRFSGALFVNDGILVNNALRNGIYLDVKNIFSDFKVSASDVNAIMDSNLVTEFDPVDDFLRGYQGEEVGGQIQALCDTITTEQPKEYKDAMIKRWLLGFFAYRSFEGYSPLVLVLQSSIQGLGKTYWMRHLLPQELQKEFFSEAKIDGKIEDVYAQMASKLLLFNDEMGNATVRDAKTFKELVSKDKLTYRSPYARSAESHDRICLFAGSTNDMEILSDSTGNRRMLPIGVLAIDQSAYNSIDKDALFVEIYRLHLENVDKAHQLTKDEYQLLQMYTEEFKKETTETELIEDFGIKVEYSKGSSLMSIHESLLIKTEVRITRKAVKSALETLGYNARRVSSEGKQKTLYNIIIQMDNMD